MAYQLKHPRSATVVTVQKARRRDGLLKRGYTLVEEKPKPKAKAEEKAT